MHITITKPTASDISGIQEVFYKSWLATYPNKEAGITVEDIEVDFKDRHAPETIERRKRALLNGPKDEQFAIAKDGGLVVGLCRAIRRDGYDQLQAVYVLPEYQRKGIGHMLWENALEFFAAGVGTDATRNRDIIVQVAVYNVQAIAFYEKLGFVDTGKRFSEERHRMPVSGALIPEMEMRRSGK